MASNNVEYILSLKDLFTPKMREAVAATDSLDGKMKATQSTASSLGGTLAKAFAVLGAGAFAKSIFDTGKQFELYQVGLKTFLKSNEEASRVFENIKRDAATTPFEVNSLLAGNRALISAGVNADQARRDVLGLANAIAASGGGNDELQRMVSNLQQIKNTGVATAADIRQFGYAGINIYGALAAATGKSTEEVKDLEVSYETLTYALNKAAATGGIFENALSNSMNTVEGKVSNLTDSFNFMKDKVFTAFRPLIVSTLDGIASVIDRVSVGIDLFKANLASIGQVLQPVVDVVAYAWDTLVGVFRSFNVGEMFNTWANALGGVFYVLKPFAILLIDVLGFALKAVIGIANGVASIVKGVAELFGYESKTFTSAVQEKKDTGSTSFAGFDSTLGALPSLSAKGSSRLGSAGGASGGIGASVSAVSGARPTSINIVVQKLVETLNVGAGNSREVKQDAPKIKDEVTKIFLEMMNDSQQLMTV